MKRKHDIHLVREYVEADKFRFSRHAVTEAKKDGVRSGDAIYVLLTGKVIEEYPKRERLLIYGKMIDGLPLHVVCDFLNEDVMFIPTVYIPASEDWIRFQIRKKQPKKKK